MTDDSTPAKRNADRLVGGVLDQIVADARADNVSWRTISRWLFTEHGLEVTDTTLRNWYPELADNGGIK